MPLASGSPTQIRTSKDTRAGLSGVPVDQFDDGDAGWVKSEVGAAHGPYYALVKAGGPAVNGVTVLSVFEQPTMRWVSFSLLFAPGVDVPFVIDGASIVLEGFPAVYLDASSFYDTDLDATALAASGNAVLRDKIIYRTIPVTAPSPPGGDSVLIRPPLPPGALYNVVAMSASAFLYMVSSDAATRTHMMKPSVEWAEKDGAIVVTRGKDGKTTAVKVTAIGEQQLANGWAP